MITIVWVLWVLTIISFGIKGIIYKKFKELDNILILQTNINEDLNRKIKALEYKIDINKGLNKKYKNIRIDELPALYDPSTGMKLPINSQKRNNAKRKK